MWGKEINIHCNRFLPMGRDEDRIPLFIIIASILFTAVLISGCLGDELLKQNYTGVGIVLTLEKGEFTSHDVEYWIDSSEKLGYVEEPLPRNNQIDVYHMIMSKNDGNGTFRVEIWQDVYDLDEGRTDIYRFYGSIETGKFDSRDKTRFAEYEVILRNEMDGYFTAMNWSIEWEGITFHPIRDKVW